MPNSIRSILLLATLAAAIVSAGPVAAQTAEIRGAVSYQGGATIPRGTLEISLKDHAGSDGSRAGTSRLRKTSDGGSKTIAFALAAPPGSPAPPAVDVIARLERADGWLVARGSARFEPGSPISITLHKVMY